MNSSDKHFFTSSPLINLLLAGLFIAYPILIYFGLVYFDVSFLGLVLILAAVLRLVIMPRPIAAYQAISKQVIAFLLIPIIIGLLAVIYNSPILLRIYPFCVNLTLFALFFSSLYNPPTIIERFARLREPNLSESGVRYTRRLTMIWCGFFMLNGAAALYTAIKTNLETWTLYNGFIAYILMGSLFLGEYAIRIWVRKK